MNNNTLNTKYIYILLLVFVLAAAYLPVTRGYYLMEDDYWTFLDRHKTISTNIGVISQAFYAARPLGAMINYSSLKYVRDISDLNYVRLLALLIVCICSCLLFNFMTKNKISTLISFATSAVVFLTPSFQSNMLKVFEINAIIATLIAIYSSILSIRYIKNDNGDNKHLLIAKLIFT